jgi:YgiT-type zinc finger domain-containing protein
MKCPLCKGTMSAGKTNLPYDLKEGNVVVIINVPALVCEQCGDDFVEIDIARKVEKLLERIEHDGVSMGMVQFDRAA